MTVRHFLSLADLTPEELRSVLDDAVRIKSERKVGQERNALQGKTVGMIFTKPSMRTRVSFEVGVYELGGRMVFLLDNEIGLAKREPLSHSGRIMSRFVHALVVRTGGHEILEELVKWSSVPVINALTAKYHPCQVLGDLQTILERKGRLNGLKVAWVGDGNNVANCWIQAAAMLEFDLALAVPEGYDPDPAVLAWAKERASTGIRVTRDPAEAVAGADVVNTDVWASMGQEAEAEIRARIFQPYQVNAQLMAHASGSAMVMHCLPAHLGEEITEEVVEGPQSAVFDEAENRLHAQKALICFLMEKR